MDVIMQAAWKAMVRDGYAISSTRPFEADVAGGICALCKRHKVVLPTSAFSYTMCFLRPR